MHGNIKLHLLPFDLRQESRCVLYMKLTVLPCMDFPRIFFRVKFLFIVYLLFIYCLFIVYLLFNYFTPFEICMLVLLSGN